MPVHLDALVVVVNRHGQLLLRRLLANHILIQVLLQFQGLRQSVRGGLRLLAAVILQDGVAEGNALVANVGAWVIAGRRDELANNLLALVAEGTTQRLVGTRSFHKLSPTPVLLRGFHIGGYPPQL